MNKTHLNFSTNENHFFSSLGSTRIAGRSIYLIGKGIGVNTELYKQYTKIVADIVELN